MTCTPTASRHARHWQKRSLAKDWVPVWTLLVYIDDATRRLLQLQFTYSERTFSYFEALRTYLGRLGRPQAIYSKQTSQFRIHHKCNGERPGQTQFGQVLCNIESRAWP